VLHHGEEGSEDVGFCTRREGGFGGGGAQPRHRHLDDHLFNQGGEYQRGGRRDQRVGHRSVKYQGTPEATVPTNKRAHTITRFPLGYSKDVRR